MLEGFEEFTKAGKRRVARRCVLISLVALAEETAAAEQKKIEETAAAEFAVLKLHLAQMPNQIVPDTAILSMSPAGLLLHVSLSMMFQATDMDFVLWPVLYSPE